MFNRRKLKKALALTDKFSVMTEKAQNEWKVSQKHCEELIKFCKEQELLMIETKEKYDKIIEEKDNIYNVLIDNYNKTTNSYNELATNYNNLIVEQWSDESKLELLNSLTPYVKTDTLQQNEEQITDEFSISILKPNK